MKRILAMALTLMLALSLCVGFATAEGQTIKGWGAFNFNDQTGITSYSQQYLWQEVASRLGITVECETVSENEKTIPDIFAIYFFQMNHSIYLHKL